MPKVDIYNMAGSTVGTMELDEAVFGIQPNEAAMHQVIKAQLANKRQGTQSALTRAEVSGGGIKPWRQKGTGRARQGSTRSPQWRHGGVVFAPKPRDYHQDVNKKVRRLAMRSALSSKVAENKLVVVDALSMEQPRTKDMLACLTALKADKKTLIVMEGVNTNVALSARNLPGVKMAIPGTINVLDVVNYDTVVATKAAVEMVQEVYAK